MSAFVNALASSTHRAASTFKLMLLAPLCLFLFFGVAAPSFAETPNKPIQINLPAGELADSLDKLGAQSGVQIMYEPAMAKGIKVPAVNGTLTVDDALNQLLVQTGLRADRVNSNTVVLKRATEKKDLLVHPVRKETAQQQLDAPSAGLEEIVVTAQKREERLQNVPISISVLSGNELDKSTAQGVSEALNAVPGVATTQNYLGGGTSVVIRGVQAAGPLFTGSSAVAYYLDSVPFGLIRSAVAPDQDAYDLERVEVLRGPQGTLYGSSALNGVVRVLSSDPNLQDFDFKVRGSDSGTQYGGNNYRGDAAVNIPIVPGILGARVVVGYENDSGWIDQINKKDVNSAELRNYRLKIKAQPTDDLSVVLSAWRSSDSYEAPSIGYSFDKSSALLDQPVSTVYDAYGLKVDDKIAGISVSSMTSYLDYTNAGSLDLLPYGFPGSIFFSGLTSNVFSQELNLTSPQDGEWRWSVGGIYTRGTENSLQTFTLIGVPPETVDMISKSYAAYGELTRLFMDGRFEVTAGLRHYHDEVSQLGQTDPSLPFVAAGGTFGANTPRAILTWHATDSLMMYASYSQGFRSGFPQDPTVSAGFPPVNPDRLRNYEFGSKGSLMGGMISYDTSIYYMKWSGIQQQLIQGLNLAVVNGQSASGVGMDFALTARPMKDLKLEAAVSWNNLEMDSDVFSGGVVLFSKGDRPNYSPETTANVSAEYQFDVGSHGYRGSAAASVNYESQQSYRTTLQGSPSLTVTQVGDPITMGRVNLSLISPANWTTTLFVNNVNNERGTPIEPFAQVSNWNARVRPRTIGLQFDYHLR